MKSKTTKAFWKCFNWLPKSIQMSAAKSYQLWRESPQHPGVSFKKVSSKKPIYSVRVSINYRALGLIDNDTIIWFWIGSHADYDKLLK